MSPDVAASNTAVPPVRIAVDVVARGSVIGPYVHIGAGSRITDSIIGPHVSLAEAAEVVGSTVPNSVAERGVRAVDATVTGSLLGAHSVVRGVSGRIDLGDPSAVGSAEWSEPA